MRPGAEAVMVALPSPAGVTVILAVVEPAETVILGGTVATPVLLLATLIVWPLAPAGDDSVTLSVADALLARLNGVGASVMTGVDTVIVTVAGLLLAVPSLTMS